MLKNFATLLVAAVFLVLFPGSQGFTTPATTAASFTITTGTSQSLLLVTPRLTSGLTSRSTQHHSSSALFGKKAARAEGNESKRKKERVKKPKDDVIEVEAVVLESLPNAMFRCAIDGAPETQAPVLATISGKIRKNFVKILVGDKVLIELSPYDLTRGRITFRYR
mmetsp:Transcript_1236/g.2163  ORF Transcript_1236/g.2163 Transcript_1236/m.2163 type:complete len:166 (+) Transcript_1236:187-684(+)